MAVPFGVGGGYESSTSRKTEAKPLWEQQPDYKESEGARVKWWDLLQQFGGEEGYGAISPDWGDIWENAQKKVQQYFWGSPTDPGLKGKMDASLARRNRSEDPAAQTMMSRMGATEGGLLSSMATEQATKKAEFSELGRQNYMQNLMQLSGMNPLGKFWTPWQQQTGSGWNVKGQVGAFG